jgi:hypothetical protein
MLKKSLIALAVLAITIPAVAGDIKVHSPWPTTYVPQEVTTIDVILDVGYYIHVKDQKAIKVSQDTSSSSPYTTYTGCKTTAIISNFDASVSGKASSSSAAGGSWSAKFDGSSSVSIAANPAGQDVQICVTGTKVALEKLEGGAKNVKVAELTIWVLPAS